MPIPPGTHRFGPGNATLSVKTGRTGAAAKAGHNLLIHVTAWSATLEVGADSTATSIVLEADASSLRVREGTGGMQALGDDDKANIQKTIDDEILKGTEHRVPLDRRRDVGRRRPAERARRADAGRHHVPDHLRRRGRRRRPAQRQRRRQADRLGHHALLDAVRHPEGRRRGRGRARRRPRRREIRMLPPICPKRLPPRR